MNKSSTVETRAPRGLEHHQIVAFRPCLVVEVPQDGYSSGSFQDSENMRWLKPKKVSQPERPGTALLKWCSQDKHIGLVKVLLSHSWLSGHSFISEAVS